MRFLRRSLVLASAIVLLIAPAARAQVQTGSITGAITDSSNALLPGVTVTLAGEKLIGGAASSTTTDARANPRRRKRMQSLLR